MNRSEILDEAKRLTTGDRQEAAGKDKLNNHIEVRCSFCGFITTLDFTKVHTLFSLNFWVCPCCNKRRILDQEQLEEISYILEGASI